MIPLLEKFVKDYTELRNSFLEHQDLSFKSFVEPHLTKTFLFSCASYYESQIQKIIENFLGSITKDERLICFAVNKGIKRQYHTYFDWDSKNGNPPENINNFLGLFGREFKDKISTEIKNNEKYFNGMMAFLLIGNLRNKMAHNNFLEYALPKTFEEIMEMNEQADLFLTFLKEKFI